MRFLRPIAPVLSGLLAVTLPVTAMAAEGSFTQRLELLERRVGRVTELTLQLDEMRRENRQLRGEIEKLGYQIEQLNRKQRDIYQDIDQRLSTLRSDQPAPVATATTPQPAPVQTGPTPAPVTSGRGTPAPVTVVSPTQPANVDREQIQAEYQAAYALLSPQQKRYAESAKAFEAFLQKYPQDPLAANAQYWLGEAHYVSQQNAAALAAFEKVMSDHPKSTKAPGALYKIGRLHQAAGKGSDARSAYERVLKDYSNSPAAGLARQRLKQLGP